MLYYYRVLISVLLPHGNMVSVCTNEGCQFRHSLLISIRNWHDERSEVFYYAVIYSKHWLSSLISSVTQDCLKDPYHFVFFCPMPFWLYRVIIEILHDYTLEYWMNSLTLLWNSIMHCIRVELGMEKGEWEKYGSNIWSWGIISLFFTIYSPLLPFAQ